MFRYITVGTDDLAAAIRFYDAVLGALGHVRLHSDPREAGWGPPGGRPQFWANRPFDGQGATAGNGSMPAFAAASRALVDACHAAGLRAGGTDEGAPGLRSYGPAFYACYLRDPQGNKISAVHEGPA